MLVVGALGVFFIASTLAELPALTMLENREVSESTKIFDRTGTKLLYEIYGEEKRTVVPLDAIPEVIKQATIAIEDAEFYSHSALDFTSLLRALLVNLRSGEVVQGGSTITQQLAKKAFLSDDRTITRKLKELVIAYKLERTFTKDQILELYLNQIPYGSNAYGVEAASQTYFQKSIREVSLAEAALLAAVPQAPSFYSPFGSHLKELHARKDLVLERMAGLGFITPLEKEEAQKKQLTFSKLKNLSLAPHFAIEVKEYLEQQYGEDFVRRAGLKVITTIDADLQAIAEKAVKAGAERNTELYKGTNAAMVVQDPKTGQILALVGSRDYFDGEIDGQFNVATQGKRQPGSALKPFVYLAGVQRGYPVETVLFDTETEFNPTDDPTKSYKPHNYDGYFRGPVNLRNSLAQSINVPAVKMLYLVGVDAFIDLLKSFGITSLEDRSRFGLSLVLGGGEVHLDELVGAYSVLSQEGVLHERHMTLSVTDQRGRVLESYTDTATPVAEPEAARAINDVLSDKNARAPLFGNSLHLTVFDGYDVALKTGTTNDYRDAWAIGYTPNLVAGVWAGNNDNTPMERRGGSILAAVPILNAFLQEALPRTQPEAFNPPTPQIVTKPMLNGSHVAYYQLGAQLYPHIHNILYYVDKKDPLGPAPSNPGRDPQFQKWEEGVLAWATSTNPGIQIGISHNQQLPFGAVLVEQSSAGGSSSSSSTDAAVFAVSYPENGSYLRGTQIPIAITVSSQREIIRVELFFNGALVDTRSGSFGRSYEYRADLSIGGMAQPQNTLLLKVTDIAGLATEKTLVLYGQ